MLRGLQAGASGFLHKDTPRIDLFKCLRAAARGDVLLSPDVLARVMASSNGKPPVTEDENIVLTLRELEVLKGVAAGERNKEIRLPSGHYRTHHKGAPYEYV